MHNERHIIINWQLLLILFIAMQHNKDHNVSNDPLKCTTCLYVEEEMGTVADIWDPYDEKLHTMPSRIYSHN